MEGVEYFAEASIVPGESSEAFGPGEASFYNPSSIVAALYRAGKELRHRCVALA